MIEYVRGTVAELTPTQAVIETAGGVGFGLSISLNTYTALQGRKDVVRLFVFEVIREDAYQLYGFATQQERTLFSLLVGISGVGGQTARMILSAFTPTDLAGIVEAEDVRSLKGVKGIGPKAASRIIIELKDKMLPFYAQASGGAAVGEIKNAVAIAPLVEEAVQALSVLGFAPAASQKVVRQILQEDSTLSVEMVIKKALKQL